MLRKLLLFTLFLLTLYLSHQEVYAEIILSTQAGGFWDNPETWEGGEVPGKNDRVEIFSTVLATNTIEVDSLYLHTGAILKRHGWWYSSREIISIKIQNELTNKGSIGTNGTNGDENVMYLMVQGNVKNQGIISPNLFGVYVSGDIENSENSDWRGELYISGGQRVKKIQTSENFLPRIHLASDMELQEDFSFSGIVDIGERILYLNGEKDIFISEIYGYGKIYSTIHDGKSQKLKVNSISGVSYGRGIETNFENIEVFQYIQGISKAKNIVLKEPTYIVGDFHIESMIVEKGATLIGNTTIYGDLRIESNAILKRLSTTEREVFMVKVYGTLTNFGYIGGDASKVNERNFFLQTYGQLNNFGHIYGLNSGVYIYSNIKNTGTIDDRVIAVWEPFSSSNNYIFSITGRSPVVVNGSSTLIENSFLGEKDIVFEVKEDVENSTPQIKRCINSELCEEKKDRGGGGVYQDTCPSIMPIKDISYTVQDTHLQRYIQLSWKNPSKEKVKVIRTSPDYRVFETSQDDFQDPLVDTTSTYSYFLVSYNACNPGMYSEQIKIPPNSGTEKESTSLYITNLGNSLYLHIPKEISISSGQKYSMVCNSNQQVILEKISVHPSPIDAKESTFETPFECEASIFDDSKKLLKSEIFTYIPTKKVSLDIATVIGWLYNKVPPTNKQEAFENFPHLALVMDIHKNATYGDIALLLTNIIGNTYIEDESTAFNTLQSSGYIESTYTKDTLINQESFLKIYRYILQHQKYFESEVQKGLTWRYTDIAREIVKIYSLKQTLKALKSEDRERYDTLLKCFSHEQCTDVDAYIGQMQKLNQGSLEVNISPPDKTLESLGDYAIVFYETYYQILKGKSDFSPEQEKYFLDSLVENIDLDNKFFGYGEHQTLGQLLLHDTEIESIFSSIISHYETLLKKYPGDFETIKREFKESFKIYLFSNELYEQDF